MIDALAHLADPRVTGLTELLARAEAVGVRDIVCANLDPEGLPRDRFQTHVRLWSAAGVHPQDVRQDSFGAGVAAVGRAAREGRLVAIGEVGLDARTAMPELALQERALRAQLDIAAEAGLPVILHCVRCIGRLCEILREHGVGPAGGVLHGFAGPAEVLPQLAALNIACSFGGLVARPQARRARAAARAIDLTRLLVESDTPDQPPPGCGPWSEPAHVPTILAAIATLRGLSVAELAKISAANARRLYKLPAAVDKMG